MAGKIECVQNFLELSIYNMDNMNKKDKKRKLAGQLALLKA